MRGVPGNAQSADEPRPQQGALALALINTETLNRGQRHDELASLDALARWWAEVRERYADRRRVEGAREPILWTSELLGAVRELRATLRALVTQVVEQHAVEAEALGLLNEILALGSAALEGAEQGHVKEVMRLRDPEKGSVLLPIAISALQLLAESDWRRLHQCTSDRCIIFFYDTTKSGTRRWCSAGCMNRARSIQHYQKTKQDVAPR